ncbi:hypothetical protein ES708_05686 [subsurface metagenome]
MSKNNKYGKINPEDLFRYTGNGLSDEERHALERELQKDPFTEEALEGLSSLGAEKVRGDLSRLKTRLRKRVTSTRSMLWVRVAASVAILLAIGTLYFTVFTDMTGRLDRRVAETESAEQAREKGIPEGMQTVTEEGKTETKSAEPARKKGMPEGIQTVTEEAKTETKTIKEDAETEGAETATVEPGPSAISVPEAVRREAEPELDVEDYAILAADKVISEDTFAYHDVVAEAVPEPEGAGAEAEAEEIELPPPGEAITLESPVTVHFTEQVRMAQQTVMDETRAEEIAGMDTAEPRRKERSAARTGADAAKAKKLPATGPARPVGGEELFNEYIAENIRFPESDTVLTRGVVVLSFAIGPQGRPQNIEVEESPGDAFSREAIRLLQEGPDWLPAIENGIIIEEKTRLSIEFIKEKP